MAAIGGKVRKAETMSNDIRFSGVAVYPHVVRADDALPTDFAVVQAEQSLLALDATQLAALARRLAAADATVLDRLADMILGEIGLEPPLGMVIGGPAIRLDDAPMSPSERFAQNVLQRVADEDCRYQLAMMQ